MEARAARREAGWAAECGAAGHDAGGRAEGGARHHRAQVHQLGRRAARGGVGVRASGPLPAACAARGGGCAATRVRCAASPACISSAQGQSCPPTGSRARPVLAAPSHPNPLARPPADDGHAHSAAGFWHQPHAPGHSRPGGSQPAAAGRAGGLGRAVPGGEDAGGRGGRRAAGHGAAGGGAGGAGGAVQAAMGGWRWRRGGARRGSQLLLLVTATCWGPAALRAPPCTARAAGRP